KVRQNKNMSGHSKWKTTKHHKAAVDAKRGKVFAKLAKIISIAARGGGGDPAMNPRLRIAVETAQKTNMPKENIERAIKRGTGADEGAKLEEITFEIYGPEGVAIIVEAITDNKNRTLSEIKKILSLHGAKLAQEGAVRWAFEKSQEEWVPKFPMDLGDAERAKLEKLFEALDEDDDVQEIYSNIK
ncbi:MAG: YebC/PmpR family DNA-binding transcriptional regulator, partial [Candidatus Spechtbacterales bacterium]